MTVDVAYGLNLNGTTGVILTGHDRAAVFDVRDATKASVDILPVATGTGAATWGTAVVAVCWALDIAGPWYDFGTAIRLTHTSPSKMDIDVSSIRYLGLVLTHAEGAALGGTARLALKGD